MHFCSWLTIWDAAAVFPKSQVILRSQLILPSITCRRFVSQDEGNEGARIFALHLLCFGLPPQREWLSQAARKPLKWCLHLGEL